MLITCAENLDTIKPGINELQNIETKVELWIKSWYAEIGSLIRRF